MAKERLDILLVNQGLVESREQAQRMIRAGHVMVDGQTMTKPGQALSEAVVCTLRELPRFVSRGGDKLQALLDVYPVDLKNAVCIDIGASTGGFTDCLLQHGASRVYAVDVGKGQLHWKLRQDERVVVMEKVNARHLEPASFDPRPRVATVDVSFISLTKVLPAIIHVLTPAATLLTLIKPQFEAGRDQVEKGGVVRDPRVRQAVADTVRAAGEGLGLRWQCAIDSPLPGPAGNVEIVAAWTRPGMNAGDT